MCNLYTIRLLVIIILVFIVQSCADYGNGCYITETGNRYHKEGCRYLDNSKISIGCDEAQMEGYIRCKVCKP